jgi:hypothetical protein
MSPFIGKASLDEKSLSALKPRFVEVGAPMKEVWEFVMPKSSYISRGFGGNPKKMAGLKDLLDRFPEDIKQIDRTWAHDALDKALTFQRNRQLGVVPKPALPYRRSYGGMPSTGEPSEGGMMSGSNMFGGPIAGLRPLPSPWAASASPPHPPSEVELRSLSRILSVDTLQLGPAPTNA